MHRQKEMNDIILYYMPESGPCRTVLLAAKLLGIKLNLKHIDLFKGEHLTEEFSQLNPLHKVPTLCDGDLALGESRVIITYLADRYGKDDKLYPKDLQKRAVINQRLYFDISDLYEPIVRCYFPGYLGKCFDETKMPLIAKGLEFLETFLSRGKYAAGNELSLADVALVSTVDTALAVLDFDLKPYANVNRWFEHLKHTLPEFDEIITKNSQKLKALVDDYKTGKKDINLV